MVEWLFLAVPWGCLGLVSVVFPDHTHLLFLVVKGYLVPFRISQIPILVFMLFYSEVSVAGDLINISLFEEWQKASAKIPMALWHYIF